MVLAQKQTYGLMDSKENPEINPHSYRQIIFNKGGNNTQWEKYKSLQQLVLGKVGQQHANQ